MKALSITVAVFLWVTGNAFAWGDEGHRIIADIAEQYLEPEAAHQVRELLAIENATTLAEVSTWADQIRGQRRETARWHYVNIPIHPPAGTKPGYVPDRDCPRGECVVAVTDRFIGVLRDKARSQRERLEALKFVVHFIADIHQPLHCANNDDRGGNDVRVIFLGRHTNLHAAWDWGILEPAVQGDERGYAMRLFKGIDATDAETWKRGSPGDWATESFKIARAKIYGEMKPEARTLELFHETEFLPVVNEQLEKAGVRLATVLNHALR
jgi:hypothetical protein